MASEKRNILVVMVGLPRSGKTTWARRQLDPIVCPDAIRQALGCYPFKPEAEPMVWGIARTMVESLFNAGHQIVILDSTATSKQRRDAWLSEKWNIELKVFDTPVEVCVQRAIENGQEYLVPVIHAMAAQMKKEPPE